MQRIADVLAMLKDRLEDQDPALLKRNHYWAI